ncbi:MAG: DUF1576 domain-containing protein [Oscillospiraceae bacterium]
MHNIFKEKFNILHLLIINAVIFIIFAFSVDNYKNVINGLFNILKSKDVLLTDYFVVGGVGAAFLNCGLIMLIVIFLKVICKSKMIGSDIGAIYLVAGFSLFGKNLLNIWPIIFGVFIYSKVNNEDFSKYLNIALYGTALAPLVTEIVKLSNGNFYFAIILYIISSLIGYILVPISIQTLSAHQGYTLYNSGFACGIIGMIIISTLKSFNLNIDTTLIWGSDNYLSVIILIYSISIITFLIGFILNGYSFKNYKKLLKHTGRLVDDFVLTEGYPITLINMGILSFAFTTYILLIGSTLNGPVIGGILSIHGFAALGKHIKNCTPIVLGILIASLFKIFSITDPSIVLAVLFGTALAPIAGQFGILAGILAGFLHSSLVLYVGALHSGTNLYNNGFATGFIAIFLVPVLESYKTKKERDKENE